MARDLSCTVIRAMAASVAVEVLNCEDLGHFLEAEGVHKDVVSTFANNLWAKFPRID